MDAGKVGAKAFEVLDRNDDGRLTFEEVGPSANGAAYVSKDEFIRACQSASAKQLDKIQGDTSTVTSEHAWQTARTVTKRVATVALLSAMVLALPIFGTALLPLIVFLAILGLLAGLFSLITGALSLGHQAPFCEQDLYRDVETIAKSRAANALSSKSTVAPTQMALAAPNAARVKLS